MSAAVSSVPAPRAAALARRELERTDFEVKPGPILLAVEGLLSEMRTAAL